MAAFVSNFEQDVFISYAHIDNRASNWVQSLEVGLRNRLSELAGADVAVWRDPKLRGNDYFDDLISKTVAKSAVFVAVVSPRYVASDSCRKEYAAFVAGQNGVRIAEQSRIARVRKTPLPAGVEEPTELAADRTLGFPFFEERDGEVIEYENDERLDGYEKFHAGVRKLAAAIDKVLRLLRNAHKPRETKHVVFLADCVKALTASREELKRELVGRGHLVVPEQSLLSDGAFAQDLASRAIESASLAVHLLGNSYGVIPDAEEYSLPHLEYALAAQRGLSQLVWVAAEPAAGAPELEPKLASLIDQITQTETTQDRSLEVCKTSFVTFKEVVLDALMKDHTFQPAVTECKSVYLLFHGDDIDSADLREIRKQLLAAGYPVHVPVFEADDGDLRVIEEQFILDNDATLIYYGNAKDSWVAQKRRFVLSALGGAQRGTQNRRGLYLCTPRTKTKELTFGDFQGGKALPEAKGFSPLYVFGDCENFSRDKLKPLLAWLSE